MGTKTSIHLLSILAVLLAGGLIHSDPVRADVLVLSHVPADYGWWNGCAPTAAGMLFGWWEEEGYDAFPGNHRDIPGSYDLTSDDPADYNDARGVVAGWNHKKAGQDLGLTYGSYMGHAPDGIADFILTYNGGTQMGDLEHGLETFAAWDDPRTAEIESQRFAATTRYAGLGWNYTHYVAEIDAGRPVLLGWSNGSEGHATLGVGYDNTGGKQNAIVLTTWRSGQQQWEWSDETASGYGFSAAGAILMQPEPDATPQLSAYCSIAHTGIGDLVVELGVGDPGDPVWNTIVWDRLGSSKDNLVLTDIDATDVLSDFLGGDLDWYLKVTDAEAQDTGTIEDFQVRYGFDQLVFEYDGGPVAIGDEATVYAFLHTAPIPEPATGVLLLFGLASLLLWGRIRCKA